MNQQSTWQINCITITYLRCKKYCFNEDFVTTDKFRSFNLTLTSFAEVDYFENYDLENIKTPINVDLLERLLIDTNYDSGETQFFVEGFRSGFDIGYHGTRFRQSKSKNIPFTVGNKIVMWNKIMKEVGEK